MTVYSVVLASGVLAASTTISAFTVPAGHTYVLRDLEVIGTQAAGNYFTVGLATPANVLVINLPYAVNTGWGQWTGRLVMAAGYVCSVRTVGPAASYYLSGYDLS